MFSRDTGKLNVLHSRIYKKDVDFGKVRWMKRNIDVCETHIRYSLPDPLRGIYVSQKLKNTVCIPTIDDRQLSIVTATHTNDKIQKNCENQRNCTY